MLPLIIFTGKLIYFISRIFNIGSGGTWPGEIATRFNPNILHSFSSQLKKGCILVAGTNGKTTTTLMIKKILEKNGFKVLHNDSGANLLNGVVSTFIQNSSLAGKIEADYGVFEVDENTLPIVLKYCHSGLRAGIYKNNDGSRVKPGMTQQLILVFLNLFRDQLDRYGEVDVIAEKWGKALIDIPKDTKIVLNADDPQVAFLGKNLNSKISFYGVNDPNLFLKYKEHATDSIFCLNCGERLTYEGIYYSHIGIWKCEKCGEKRPKPDISDWNSPIPGVYNKYNTLAAVAVAKLLGITDTQINLALADFSPAFGRQEEFIINGKNDLPAGRLVKIFLSKNPAGFNESLRTVISMGAKELLLVLNDRIPDGRDVSWIWDVDTEKLLNDSMKIVVSGDRSYDMGLRIKYSFFSEFQISNFKFQIEEDLSKAINLCFVNTPKSETLFIMATYSAMLEVRKILKGRKIL